MSHFHESATVERSAYIPPPVPQWADAPADADLPPPWDAADAADVADAAETQRDIAYPFVRRNDVRNLTPRQMSALCGELFLATMISCDEYLMIAFQPELHPDYDRTIGALTGEAAAPNQPRDYIRRWTDRLDFERKFNADDHGLIERTQNILSVLRRLDTLRARLV